MISELFNYKNAGIVAASLIATAGVMTLGVPSLLGYASYALMSQAFISFGLSVSLISLATMAYSYFDPTDKRFSTIKEFKKKYPNHQTLSQAYSPINVNGHQIKVHQEIAIHVNKPTDSKSFERIAVIASTISMDEKPERPQGANLYSSMSINASLDSVKFLTKSLMRSGPITNLTIHFATEGLTTEENELLNTEIRRELQQNIASQNSQRKKETLQQEFAVALKPSVGIFNAFKNYMVGKETSSSHQSQPICESVVRQHRRAS